MSKDIRSFFKPIVSNGSKANNDLRPTTQKKRVFNIDDSDEEQESFVKKPTAKKLKSEKVVKSTSPIKKTPEKVVVDVSTFFGKSPVQQKPQIFIKPSTSSIESKPKVEEAKKKKSKKNRKSGIDNTNTSLILEDHFDDDFEATLCELDEKVLCVTPKKEKKNSSLVESSSNLGNDIEKLSSEKSEIGKTSPTSLKKGKKNPTDRKESCMEIDISKEDTPSKVNKKSHEASKGAKTPGSEKKDLPPSETDQKRKANAEAYQKFLNRGGPRNPGSKPIPKVTPKCLEGKTFVITGVLDSLEREEATDLISKCGGRVVSSISKKTSYIVIGEEAGVSKLEKAEKLGISKLNEDGLLGLIRSFEASKKEVATEEESKYFKGDKRKERSPDRNTAKRVKNEEDSKKKSPEVTKVTANKVKTTLVGSTELSDSGIGFLTDSSTSIPKLIDASSVKRTVETKNLGDSLWVEKYKPTSTKNIIGQNGDKSNVKKLTKWLTDWYKHHGQAEKKKTGRPAPWAQNDDGSFYKAALLSGPPGVGKTTSVHLVCQEVGYDIIEFNASDTRSKKLLSEHVSELLGSKSIKNFYSAGSSTTNRHVLVMDEVDGMAGNEDRGGVQELIQLIKNTKVPVVCMCNDRSHPKMRSLVNYCFDLRYQRPRVVQIKGAMMSICCKEGIKIPGNALDEMIMSANQDIRQVLHNLSLWAVKDKSMSADQVKLDAAKAKKSLKMGPWDVARQVFSASQQEKSSLREKEDLFFQDYSLGPLFVQDTYVRVKPYKAHGDKLKTLECLSNAAESLAWGDVVERKIRSQNAWGLLPVQAIFSSVIPGNEMTGHVMGQITFPEWLGKNSKRGRIDRLLQELHVHTRLSTSGNKKAMNLDYSQVLRDFIIRPLSKEGTEGVPDALKVMQEYQLLREDLDSLVELCQWPKRPDPFSSIESKVKAAFTRAYNKESLATPYAATVSIKKSKVDESELLEEALDNENVEEVEEEGSKDDIATDAMIKKGKSSNKKVSKKDDAGPSGELKGKGSKKGGKTTKK